MVKEILRGNLEGTRERLTKGQKNNVNWLMIITRFLKKKK
jgi:hypothetical protein